MNNDTRTNYAKAGINENLEDFNCCLNGEKREREREMK